MLDAAGIKCREERRFFNEIRPKEPFRERGTIIAGLLFVRCEEGRDGE